MRKFDLIVIGSGSGLEVSADVSDAGRSVAVIEEGPFGGTCLNRGCIPSKMLIHCADVMQTVQNAAAFGIHAKVERIDWRFIVQRAFEEVDADAAMIERGNRQSENIEVFKGRGRFTGPKTIAVTGPGLDEEELTADTILIAAGTRPWVPDIPGLDRTPYITSDEALRLPEQPRRLTIIGGGYIAAELAHFFGALGTEVTIIHRRGLMLREEDEDVSRRFTEVYQRRFTMMLDSQAAGVSSKNGEIIVEVTTPDGSKSVTSDTLLMATGRVPNTDSLEVAKTGVELNQRGYIKTDEHLQTNVPGIWALGDIVGRYLLKHNANLEAAYASNNILDPENQAAVDYHAMPHAVFASPQVASVGLTQQEAEGRGAAYVAATYAYSDTAYGASIEDKDGFVKVLADPETGEILGCHIIGTDAATLIQEVANAMRLRLGVDAITQSIYVHPALPEVLQRAFGQLPV
ncbi:MAG: mycothione reductase [Chloroflexi bacterium]|nr:mycothione reductase [Chloroflexota bacterium]MCI0801029.1 mycothione reductase [Chloroflexota bacterium]MCI0810998.1 mycothione reductase [Chloroflexota bacterium]MCI0863676.1 mycothione reductase [Chloroflexota bacterium]MCI0898123.1 mycothione reductase [Chloroflexota bacterium]